MTRPRAALIAIALLLLLLLAACGGGDGNRDRVPVSYTHLRAHETVLDLVCRLLLEKKRI